MSEIAVHMIPCPSCVAIDARLTDALRRGERDAASAALIAERNPDCDGAVAGAAKAAVLAERLRAVVAGVRAALARGCGLGGGVWDAEDLQAAIAAIQYHVYRAAAAHRKAARLAAAGGAL